MELREVVFGFSVVLAATLDFGYVVGDFDDPTVHHPAGLIAAVVVSLLTTALTWGDRTRLGAVHLATSLVADLHLITALAALGHAALLSTEGMKWLPLTVGGTTLCIAAALL